MQTFKPVGRCIYCGTTAWPLQAEHIIPFALNGVLELPEASCKSCEDITKKFEQTVARTMYGVLRVKRGFQTRRKKERPRAFQLSYEDNTGAHRTEAVEVAFYPTIYLALELPPPGVLLGLPPSNRSPEMKVILKGNESEIAEAMSFVNSKSLALSSKAAWGDFCRLLAKIAHSYLIAVVGEDWYVPLLPDLILGRSPFLSHYVGGWPSGTHLEAVTSDLAILLVTRGNETFLVVSINLLGEGRLPRYQVVAGKVTNLKLVMRRFARTPTCETVS